MAHSNVRIYIDTSVTPPIGVSIADIQAMVGLAKNDIGALILYGFINIWAKYKPESHPTIKRPLTEDERRANHWGLTIPVASHSLSQIVSNYTANYAYARPKTTTDWYRFSDWVKWDNGWVHGKGYLKTAKCFYEGDDKRTNSYSGSANHYVNYGANTAPVSLSVLWAQDITDEMISLSDLDLGITSLANAYLGVILVTGTTYRLIVSETSIGSASQSILDIPASIFTSAAGSTFTIYPILSTGNENATGEGVVTDMVNFDLFPLPTEPYTFRVVDANNTVSFSNETISTSLDIRERQSVDFSAQGRSSADIASYTQTFYVKLYGKTSATEDTWTLIDTKTVSWSISQQQRVYSESWPELTNRFQTVKVEIEDSNNTVKLSATASLS